MKAILLIRVSTLSQDLQQQTERVMHQAIADGYNEIVTIEEKESGSKLKEDERLGLNRMKEMIENDSNIECVYVYELSRLSRRANVLFSIRDYLIERKIQLVCLTPMFRLLNAKKELDESSNIFFGIFAAMAENETMIRKSRTERGIQKLISEGKHGRCRPLFGYAVDEQKYYIPHPENSKIVQMIYRLYGRGKSIRRITIEIQERGYFPNVTFSDLLARVYKILKDERYTGIKPYPALIDKETYDAAYILRKSKCKEHKTTTIYLCKGILKDKYTGQTLSPQKTLKRYSTLNINRLETFKQVSVRFDIIEPLILEYSIRQHKVHKKTFTQDTRNRLNAKKKIQTQKIKTLNAKVQKLYDSRDIIEERLILGRITKAKAEQLENKLNFEINETKHSIAICEQLIDNIDNQLNFELTNQFIDYDNMTKEEQVKLIREVVNIVYISKSLKSKTTIEIHNNFDDNVEIRTFLAYGRFTREIENDL